MADDFIRRSDVLEWLDGQIKTWVDTGCTTSIALNAEIATLREVREVIAGLPGVLPPQEKLKLFTKEFGDGRKEYRYGPEWVARELLLEGGYPTPEEAKLHWLESQEKPEA